LGTCSLGKGDEDILHEALLPIFLGYIVFTNSYMQLSQGYM